MSVSHKFLFCAIVLTDLNIIIGCQQERGLDFSHRCWTAATSILGIDISKSEIETRKRHKLQHHQEYVIISSDDHDEPPNVQTISKNNKIKRKRPPVDQQVVIVISSNSESENIVPVMKHQRKVSKFPKQNDVHIHTGKKIFPKVHSGEVNTNAVSVTGSMRAPKELPRILPKSLMSEIEKIFQSSASSDIYRSMVQKFSHPTPSKTCTDIESTAPSMRDKSKSVDIHSCIDCPDPVDKTDDQSYLSEAKADGYCADDEGEINSSSFSNPDDSLVRPPRMETRRRKAWKRLNSATFSVIKVKKCHTCKTVVAKD